MNKSLVLCFLLLFAAGALAQDSNEMLVKKKIEAKNYTFTAHTMLPLGARSRQLTSYYFIRVSKDSLMADLPYIGKAYNAPIGRDGGGIRFTSTDFDYTVTPDKKNGWKINIKPKDVNDPRQISLFISSSGQTTVNINSNNRQAITYTGTIL